MKKLLLLAVLALGVVACDKDEMGMDSMSINPLNNVEVGMTKQDAFNFINGSTFDIKENKNVEALATRKSTSNSIQVGFFTGHGDTYAHMVSEDISVDTCYSDFTAVSTFDYVYAFPALTVIDLSDSSEQSFTLSSGLQARYDGIFGQALNSMFTIDYATNGNPTTRIGVSNPTLQSDGTFSL